MALCNIDCTIAPGEFVCIVGSAGSGKTLLLELLMGERKSSSGKVRIDEVDLSALSPALLRLYRREIGAMLQQDQLIQNLSVASNVALALELRKLDPDLIAQRVTDLLGKIGLYDKVAYLPKALSKGERRRIALAQAVAAAPKILLLDEPFADVDEKSTQIMHAFLHELHKKGTTIVLATRNPKTTESLGTRTLRLERGEIVRDSAQRIRPTEKSSLHVTPSMV